VELDCYVYLLYQADSLFELHDVTVVGDVLGGENAAGLTTLGGALVLPVYADMS
jgi:hypothetical protein